MFSVQIREKGGDSQSLDFDRDEVSIGRIQGNDIMLPKGNISKRHARIMVKDGKFVIVDLRSTNGTYVNGHKISSPVVIGPDDKVYIGDYVIQLDGAGAVDADEDWGAPPDESEPVHLAEEPEDEVQAPEDVEEAPRAEQPQIDEAAEAEEPETVSAEAAPEEPAVEEPAAEDWSAPAEVAPARVASGIDELSEFEQYIRVLAMLHQRAGQEVFASRDIESIDFASQWEELENAVYAVVDRAHKGGEVPGFLDVGGLTTDILYEYTALGPIEYFLADDRVTEIEVNAYNQIYVRRGSLRTLEWKSFSSPVSYNAVVDRLARSQGADPETRGPLLHGRLEDGTTYRGALTPVSPGGPMLVFRKPRREVRSLQQLVEGGVLDSDMAGYLEGRIARDRATVIVAGRHATGRTSVLNSLAWLIPEQDRIAVVEELQELHLPHANIIRLDPSEGALDVVAELRPDRVLLGELTEDLVLPFLRVSSGRSDGCMAAAHARNTPELITWLRTALAVEDGITDQSVQSSLIGLAVELIVLTERDGDVMRIAHVAEVSGDGPDGLRVTDVFRHTGAGEFERLS